MKLRIDTLFGRMALLIAAVLVIMVAAYGGQFAAIILLVFALYAGCTVLLTRRRMKVQRQVNVVEAQTNSKVVDSLLNYDTVKYFARESFEARRLGSLLDRWVVTSVQNQHALSALHIAQSGCIAVGVACVMLLGVQRVAQGADDQAAHQGGIAEPDLGLGRVDVDVDEKRIDVQEQGRRRVPVPRQEVGVGAAERALQQAVLHGAAVDEQILVRGVAPAVGRQAGVARQAHAVAFLVDQQGVGLEVAAQQGGQALQAALVAGMFGRQAQGGLAVQRQGEGDGLVRHGLALDLFGDGHGLGPLGLHELEPGGGGVEQVAHLDPRAMRAGEGGGGQGPGLAALDRDGPGVGLVTRPGGDRQAGDRADGGQGLAPEAQGVDAQQVHVAGVVRLQL